MNFPFPFQPLTKLRAIEQSRSDDGSPKCHQDQPIQCPWTMLCKTHSPPYCNAVLLDDVVLTLHRGLHMTKVMEMTLREVYERNKGLEDLCVTVALQNN